MIKTNIKMRVAPEQSAKVQEICFNNNIYWSGKIIEKQKKANCFLCVGSALFWGYIGEEIDPELFIRTNGSCIEKEEFTYPMWFKNKIQGYVVRFDGLKSGKICIGDNMYRSSGTYRKCWNPHTNTEIWEQVPNPDLVTDKEIEQTSRGDGGSTNYYELPKGATELRHLIRHKKMSHSIGEIFCAIYRLNDNGEYLRNLKKAKFYIDSEIEEHEKENK